MLKITDWRAEPYHLEVQVRHTEMPGALVWYLTSAGRQDTKIYPHGDSWVLKGGGAHLDSTTSDVLNRLVLDQPGLQNLAEWYGINA